MRASPLRHLGSLFAGLAVPSMMLLMANPAPPAGMPVIRRSKSKRRRSRYEVRGW
ncbi:hypothetical protein [Methylogaea oryzae]|uniref:hypothetical protein n=1 Tax=Methylogaea oryzae TaxID=1295382 RepID=UPI001C81E9DC|nr:hypothetical protein [Methylogaea oryzae]